MSCFFKCCQSPVSLKAQATLDLIEKAVSAQIKTMGLKNISLDLRRADIKPFLIEIFNLYEGLTPLVMAQTLIDMGAFQFVVKALASNNGLPAVAHSILTYSDRVSSIIRGITAVEEFLFISPCKDFLQCAIVISGSLYELSSKGSLVHFKLSTHIDDRPMEMTVFSS